MHAQRNYLRVLRPASLTIALATALVVGASSTPALAAPADSPAAAVAVPGATIIGQRSVSDRTVELTVATPSFTAPAKVEVMLPTGYDEQPNRRWPVTVYLTGTNGDQDDFRTDLNGEAATANFGSIVVAPSSSLLDALADSTGLPLPSNNVGAWSDWYNFGSGGPPMYETFVTQQLIPLIDANYRTIADRAHRAVAGFSGGGYGAVLIAARNPELFAAVSSLSGAVDSNWILGLPASTATPLFNLALPDSVYGPRLTEEVRWRGHNPVDLAENLRGIDVQLYTGNGVLGAQELNEPAAVAGCLVEGGAIRPETDNLRSTLLSLGIPHAYTAYNWGCHSTALGRQELQPTLARFSRLFATPAGAPTTIDHRSINPQFEAYGWSVSADPNRALEFLDLQNAGPSGFTLTGTGTTQVVTPALFSANRRVTVTVDGVTSVVRANGSGQLTLAVDLGPASRDQQYRPGAITNLRQVQVQFSVR